MVDSVGKMREDEEVLSSCGIKAPKSKVSLYISDPFDSRGVTASKPKEAQPSSSKRERVKVELSTGNETLLTLKVSVMVVARGEYVGE